MGILGRDPRTDAERRRLYRLACDALLLLRHRNPGRSEEALEDAVGDAVVKWLSVELPIPLTDPQVSCWLITTSSHFLFRSTLKGTPYLQRLEGPCPVEGEAWIQERVLVREVLARYRQLRITARTHQSMELWAPLRPIRNPPKFRDEKYSCHRMARQSLFTGGKHDCRAGPSAPRRRLFQPGDGRGIMHRLRIEGFVLLGMILAGCSVESPRGNQDSGSGLRGGDTR